ncbi:MAG TPA: PHP domain-containing protein [Dehalococcoidales bacterium]|nr:PHP domain-containing protein [Dehalococcoidales bacterium]
MPGIDLHIHTSASDGRFSPAEIVSRSAAAGLAVIAITDHDTVDGIAPALQAARTFPSLRVIPGVEISTDIPAGQAHILGYFLDYNDHELQIALEKMRNSRWERARKMVARLEDLGCRIEWERVREIAGAASVGRPHIAQALMEKDYVESFKDAFTRYISQDGPAYVERDKMTPVQAAELILQAKGLPVLAHPLTVPDPEAMVIELKAAGLTGIEVYYKDYSRDDINRLLRLSDRYGLVNTGGTDYHGLEPETDIDIGGVDVPAECVEQLLTLAQQRELKPANP